MGADGRETETCLNAKQAQHAQGPPDVRKTPSGFNG